MKKIIVSFLSMFLLWQAPQQVQAQDQILGEIRMFAFNFVPKGWMECSGQTLPISQNTALFSLLGVNYGGDGRTTFMLPNLNGRTAIHADGYSGYYLGETGGTETETMTVAQMPVHAHAVLAANALLCASGAATTGVPGVFAAVATRGNAFSTVTNANSAAIPATIANTGGSQPRNNMQPYLTFVWCIATTGIYPARY